MLYAHVFMRIGVACACACVYCDVVLPRQSLSGATPRGRENDLVHTILRRGKRQLLDAMVSRWLWRLIDVKCNNFAPLMSPDV